MARELEEENIRELLRKNPKGLTIEEVSKKLSLNRTTAAKYLNAFVLTGQADMRMLGSAKLFYLTQRVPLTNVLSLSSDLILILDSDLFIQEINTAFLAYFKLDKGDLKATQFAHSPMASHFSAREMSCIERALDGEGSALEVRFDLLGDGRFFKMKCIPLTFDSGARAVGIILEDITEMKTYQHELEQRVRERTAEVVRAKDFAENLISTANAMIIGLDPKGDVTIFNKAAAQVTGYSPGEILGKNWFETVVPKARFPEIWEEFRRLSGRGVPDTTDRPILTKSGDIRYISWSNNNILEEGTVVATISFGIDITERKNAEEMVKKANKQVALLTSVTRHDIINQITSLKGYIGILKRQCTDEKIAGVLQKEEEIAEMILRQIVFTRDYQNVGAEPPRWIQVQDTLNKILQSVDRGSITIAVDTGDLEIYADPLIEKVFFNLIDNTLRHGGQVSRIRVSCEEQEKDLILVYEDNGEGIPDDIKEQIFTRGFGKNTGYGLFLIREILSITGFSIHENGRPGHGARFVIHIPYASYRLPDPAGTAVE
jgi:PAS domain S-box-containing protein